MAVLSACVGAMPQQATPPPAAQPAAANAVPVMVYRPEDELALCVDKITRRPLAFARCNGGTAVANDPPGTPQVPMMIYRRADGRHYCINYLNMEVLPSWRCT